VKRHLMGVWAAGLSLVLASAAWAQLPGGAATPVHPRDLLQQVISTLIFGLVGILLAIIGFKLFDLVIPFHLEKEICEKNNIAVAILAGAMILGICIIVAFVVIAP
jgi:hypothetical protein